MITSPGSQPNASTCRDASGCRTDLTAASSSRCRAGDDVDAAGVGVTASSVNQTLVPWVPVTGQ
jgi:hypothetical protein